ncbi:MAG: trehalose-phosphatase [Desulfobacteraceae bacterium]|nr:MAG: trehalose-phosphatase [Desulfobacteraceae bacterium]
MTTCTLDLKHIDAVIFDLDGVVVDSAGLHAEAWQEMFNAFLLQRRRQDAKEYALFDYHGDYLPLVDGKPRYAGVAAFLQSRGIDLPYGDPADDPDRHTVCGLGNRKNLIFNQLLQRKGARAYDPAVALIRRLRKHRIKTALVTSSKNGRAVLKATALDHLFDVIADGNDAREHQLEGKPAPDVFLWAARQVGVPPGRAAVIEDAQSGVAAGRRGGFGLVIGVNRADQEDGLRRHGADCVVDNLARVRLENAGKPRSADGSPALLERFDAFKNMFCEKEAVIFLDYDGTLTPIVRSSEEAHLSGEMRSAVQALARHCRVAVVSGRDLDDVRRRVGLPDLYYAGSHGFDIRGPEDHPITHRPAERFLAHIQAAAGRLKEQLKDIDGVHIEQKQFSVAVHYREAPPEQSRTIERVVELVRTDVGGLRVSRGKKVFDLQPDLNWHKGKAVRWLLEEALELDLRRVLPVFIGDDVTDEDAFEELREIGIGIVVAEEDRPSRARFRLRDSGQVQAFLQQAAQWLNERSAWRLVYHGFDAASEKLRETLCTLGNGYFCTRGASAQAGAGEVHYPGTYLAGGYNRLQTEISGHIIENEDLVNMPNWLPVNFRIGDGPWFSMATTELLSYRQTLDIRNGVLQRFWRYRDDRQRITRAHEQRIVHMGQAHLAALTVTLTPENWSGRVEFRSALDGRVSNSGVARYQGLNNVHLRSLETRPVDPETILLKTITHPSALQIAMAARTRLFTGERELAAERRTLTQEGYVCHLLAADAEEGTEMRLEKTVALYTSRDAAISEAGREACQMAGRAPSFARLLEDHRRSWDHLWRRFSVELWHDRPGEKDPIDMIVHLYIFHLLQTTSINTMQMGLDVGVPPRGWHGEAYRGHVFWDELFIFPMLNLRLPQITRALLMYRYRRLAAARRASRRAGYAGAMYPWQSGSNGREESQRIHLNPRSGRWLPDHSRLQRHVNIAIAYNLDHYFQVSNDMEFMSFYGAEMMMEIARFLASLCSYNAALDRYEILHVMGPDEYHDAYPGAEQPGLNNNAYTNIMTVWVLSAARRMLDLLPADTRFEVCDKLQLHRQEFEHWEEIGRKMRVVFHADGIISQFEGYDELKEFAWERYREKYGDIQRLDRILEAEGDTPNRYKASKQADVLMLFYLLSAEELTEIFQRLGYPFAYDTIPKNIDYYIKRTSHGSTLSRVVHAWVLARSDRVQSWKLFYEALQSDVTDIQGGTTAEGIHLGAMAGTVDLLQRGYTGIVTREDVLWFNPCLPKELNRLRIRIRYRSHFLEVDLTTERLKVRSLRTAQEPIRIGFKAEVRTLSSDSSLVFELADVQKQRNAAGPSESHLSRRFEENVQGD